MSLTFSHGPLSRDPSPSNYTIEGPAHRLLFEPFPRRARAVVNGDTLFDTRDGKLLYETGILPVLYVPEADFDAALLEPSDHTSHCPFKGDASYWNAAGRENAVWAYLDPLPEAEWLRGYRAVYRDLMDTWLDEDEQVPGLRDPYHRVDVRRTSRRVRVTAGGQTVAESERPMLLSETGLPNRIYIPREDVRTELLEPSDTRAACPYKGYASYWSLKLNGSTLEDVAWSYPEPFEAVVKATDHVCFLHDEVTVEPA